MVESWNQYLARVIRAEAFHGGDPPLGHTIAQDLRWVKYRMMVLGDSAERVSLAIRGVKLLIPELKTKPFSPAKVFSRKGPWASLFERSLTAEGKRRFEGARDQPYMLRSILKQIVKG